MELTIQQIARSLNLPEDTVQRWIRQGRIPIRTGPEGCKFHRDVLEKWAREHHLPFRPPRTDPGPRVCTPDGGLLAAMKRGGVHAGIDGRDAPAVLAAAVERIPDLTSDQRSRLFDRLLERERLTSTGIGRGVAIPHPRSPLEDLPPESLIATCFPHQPVDFEAVDGRPVFVLFVMLSATVPTHLKMLSRLAFCVREPQFLDFLQTLPTPETLYEKIAAFELRCEKCED